MSKSFAELLTPKSVIVNTKRLENEHIMTQKTIFFRWATFKTLDPLNSHWTPYIWVLQSLKCPGKIQLDPCIF